jgi:isopenicillin-N epimerase
MPARPISPLPMDPLQDQLRIEHSIEIPVMPWPVYPHRVIRYSAQLYNSLPQYRLLAKALAEYFP